MEDLVIEPMTATLEPEDFDEDDLNPLDFDFDSIEEYPSFYRRLQIFMTRMKSTKVCFGIYILMAVSCGIVFFTAAFGTNGVRNSIAFTVAEALINLLLVLEVVCDIIILGRSYWTRVGNVIDFIVTLACIVFFFTFLEEDRNMRAFGDDSLPALNAVLLGIRYFFQLFRAMLCAVRGHNTMQMLAQDEVEVHDLELQNMVRMNGNQRGPESPGHHGSSQDESGLAGELTGPVKYRDGLHVSGFMRRTDSESSYDR
mmetsp:Transcript_16919/g.33056  ORF Transcript_16919/g.33056 Transcript_16919/m.33056 type:complete len:256 (+) Transcript_16919:165-932(+)